MGNLLEKLQNPKPKEETMPARRDVPVFEAAQPRLGTYPACLLWVLCVCLAGSAVTLLLRQIPGIKKLI